MHGAELEGLACDDTDSARLCIGRSQFLIINDPQFLSISQEAAVQIPFVTLNRRVPFVIESTLSSYHEIYLLKNNFLLQNGKAMRG